MGLVERLVALAVNWLDRRSPSARWESREDHEARALLPFGGLDLELRHDAGSLRVSSALEDCRRDDDAWLDDSLRAWEARRDASPAVRDRVEICDEGRVIYARFFVDDDATDDEVEARLDEYLAWLRSTE